MVVSLPTFFSRNKRKEKGKENEKNENIVGLCIITSPSVVKIYFTGYGLLCICKQITGDLEAVKKAMFAVSTIMYKFTPMEDIPLETTIPEVPPTIIIPSDIPLYPSVDSILPSKSLPSILGASVLLHIYQNFGVLLIKGPHCRFIHLLLRAVLYDMRS